MIELLLVWQLADYERLLINIKKHDLGDRVENYFYCSSHTLTSFITSPCLMRKTASMPSMTWPNTV